MLIVVLGAGNSMICGPLAFLAAARGIPVVLIFGLFGCAAFCTLWSAERTILPFMTVRRETRSMGAVGSRPKRWQISAAHT